MCRSTPAGGAGWQAAARTASTSSPAAYPYSQAPGVAFYKELKTAKRQYIKNKGLAGVMIDSLEGADAQAILLKASTGLN
ncbi:hypothetical protein [Streptomyces justiciae]|uniref:hypothetical protein n=1 Tax=Streptomyces justiciae TaxID=2780140 RepID=UPI0018830AF0|nr:hypothetical protein [Streptomyces justiciae]MBE8474894.1 hypothetical protein [Streptomyces justiciae]